MRMERKKKNITVWICSHSNPMYRVYSGFLNKKEAEKEEKRVINKIEEYKEAKTLEEYLEQLREGIV